MLKRPLLFSFDSPLAMESSLVLKRPWKLLRQALKVIVKILGEMESGLLICVNNTLDLLKYGTEYRIGVPNKKTAGHYPSPAMTNGWTTPAVRGGELDRLPVCQQATCREPGCSNVEVHQPGQGLR